MGTGYEYFCEKCQKDFPVFLGRGMAYPSVYEELLADIKSGEYSEEMKTAALSNRDVVVDAERHLYVCSCGCWENTEGLSLFVPKDEVHIKNPYDLPHIMKSHYIKVFDYIHKCPECGKQMNEADYQPIDLRCPECKTLCSYRGEICWD